MNRPLVVVCLRQATRIRRLTQQLADLSVAYRRAIRINHRMADNLAAANRERDDAAADAELLFGMLPESERAGATLLVRCRRWVDSLDLEETT